MTRTFVFGDIHGCYDEMMALYKKLESEVKLNPKKDIVGFVGDYVDRGPKTKQVVEQLIKWNRKYPHWFFLYGNHEDLMLDALKYGGYFYHSYDLWFRQGGKQTAESYFPSGMSKYDIAVSQPSDHIIPRHLDWLSQRNFYHQDSKYFYVHAGVVPGPTLKQQVYLLENQSSEEIRKCFIWARDGFIDSDHVWDKKIIFGHTADYHGKYNNRKPFWPIVMDNKIGLDTAICPPANQRLTAIQLPEERFFFQESFQRTKNL